MINQKRYVKIVSGVGAGAAVAQRRLIMRAITQNSVLPPGIVAEFPTSDSVSAYFGSSSEEYKRALAYFSFVSKSIQSPSLISFARWVSAAIAPMIVGDSVAKLISQFAGFNAGTLQLLDGANTVNVTGINTSTAPDLNTVANTVQAAVRQAGAGAPIPSTPTTAVTGGSLSATSYYKVSAILPAGETVPSTEVSVAPANLAVPSLSSASSSATGGTLAANTYFYKITAVGASGETIASNEMSVTTTGTTSSVSLIWTTVPGAAGYRIYRGTATGAENAYYAPAGTAATFTDTGAATTAGTPPTTNTATSSTNANTISWSAVTGATGYRIYRGTGAGAENVYYAPAGTSTTFTDTGAASTSGSPQGTVVLSSQLVNATVTYNSNTSQFVMTGSVTGSGNLSAVNTGQTADMSVALGLSTKSAVNVPGQAADTPDVAVSKSANISNNFGSFIYCTPSVPLTNAQIAAIATWNDAQNNMYMYSVPTLQTNAAALFALVSGFSGCALSLQSPTTTDYIEQSPCEILAATNYDQVNSTQNYMFYQFAARATTVSDDTTADAMDAIRTNYIGVTQSAGQQLAFYQRGILCGGSQAAVDMNTYANEMWMKSAISAQILSLFLNAPTVPANEIGQTMLLNIIQSVITKARNNGVISAGKVLTAVQQQVINRLSADPMAWRQIQNIGYWINLTFQSYVNPNTKLTEYKAVYQLLYSKDDAIRLVEGSDIMI